VGLSPKKILIFCWDEWREKAVISVKRWGSSPRLDCAVGKQRVWKCGKLLASCGKFKILEAAT